LTRELLDAPIPDSILAAVEPTGGLQQAELEGAVRTAVERYEAPPVTLNFLRFWLSGDPAQKAQVLANLLSFKSIAGSLHGSPRTYLYYLFRLVKLSRRYGPLMARLTFGNPQSQEMIDRERAVLRIRDWLDA
jgi:hypothetical protein